MTVFELTERHIGWRIETGRDRHSRAAHHRFRLVGLRMWSYDGLVTVGLVDGEERAPGVVGLERAFDPDTLVTLIRPETAKAKRLAVLDRTAEVSA